MGNHLFGCLRRLYSKGLVPSTMAINREVGAAKPPEIKKEVKKIVPDKVRDLKCVKCGELLLRIYPWALVQINDSLKMICKRCYAKNQ